jgi:acyl-ACP thioesterase
MESLKKTWKDEYFVHWQEADFRGFATMTTICNYLQETAWQHANHHGFGYDDAGQLNQFWVILRWFVKMDRYPKWRDKILVETWPRPPEGIFAYRDYVITTFEGEKIGVASSTWLILDAKTRRPQKLDLVKNTAHLTTDKMALGENAAKIVVPSGIEYRETILTKYCDMDFNGHVNNTRYVEWCLNLFDSDFHQANRLASFQVNFMHESKSGEEIELLIHENSPEKHVILAKSKTNGKDVFAAELGWVKNRETGE